MKIRLLSLFVLGVVVMSGLASCNDDQKDSPYTPTGDDTELKGIWKLAYARFEGGLLPGTIPFYAIIDPATDDMVLVTQEESEGGAMTERMKLDADGETMTIIAMEDFEEYRKNPDGKSYVSRFPYTLLDGEFLHLYPQAVKYLVGDDVEDLTGKSFHLELYRQTELEAKVSDGTKAGDNSWLANATAVVIDEIDDEGTVTYKIDEYKDFVTGSSWNNTGGWQRVNWMSHLPDSMPVAWVNIPGSHDSATARSKMGVEAATTDACVQVYTIMEQYRKGARFFDFRVGSSLKWDFWPFSKRMMTEEEMNKVKDLEMFHGPLSTDTYFIASIQELANEILKDSTEFIFINVQAERESSGLYDWAATWLEDKARGTSTQSKMFEMVTYQSMKIANRLLKEFSRKYNDDIFIPYSPNLTVGQARGHIIVMEDKSNMKFECKGLAMTGDGVMIDKDWLKASFYTGWPSNGKGYATLFTYSEADSLKNDLYVQSYYEMKVHEKEKIGKKEKEILELTRIVTAENMNPDRKNVLGFNAMNANTGSGILKTYVFAHEFNGYAYEMFVNRMKDPEINPLHCGIVAMDHYGAQMYELSFSTDVKVYGDILSWAVIESNFYKRDR